MSVCDTPVTVPLSRVLTLKSTTGGCAVPAAPRWMCASVGVPIPWWKTV